MKSYWLNFAVTDVERALNFYRNIGFEIIDERSNNETLGAFKIGDNTICIFKQDILEQFMQTPLKGYADHPEIILSFPLICLKNTMSMNCMNVLFSRADMQ
ncbi:hypothetical protein MKY53_02390 [Macrococcus sp. FSL R5-0951]